MKCKICSKELKQITNSHLRTHNITTKEYKEHYGSVVSDEFRKECSERTSGKNNPNFGNSHTVETKLTISNKNKGRTPHNKGIPMSSEQKALLSDLALSRNKKWNETNTHPVKGQKRSEETKQKIKEARSKQIITAEQVQKAIQTKIDRGYDLAFFRGHKHTVETKEKLSEISLKYGKIKSEEVDLRSKERLLEFGYLLKTVTSDGKKYIIKCLGCNNTFERTRQYTNQSRNSEELCPICHPVSHISKAERKIANWISTFTTVIRSNRTIVKPKELDIYLPEYNLAIEYNGRYWHNPNRYESKEKWFSYHQMKIDLCEEKGIQLLHLWEDYEDHNDLIDKAINGVINNNLNKVLREVKWA